MNWFSCPIHIFKMFLLDKSFPAMPHLWDDHLDGMGVSKGIVPIVTQNPSLRG